MSTTPLRSFDLDRTYPAPPARVWAAFTTAELLRRWACPDPGWDVSECTVDARADGGYRLRFGPRPGGDACTETATFTTFEPVTRLVLEVRTTREGMDEASRATVVLVPVPDGTRLDLTVDGLSEAAEEGMRTGWEWCLAGVAEALAAPA